LRLKLFAMVHVLRQQIALDLLNRLESLPLKV
jgi:hypothetical protein